MLIEHALGSGAGRQTTDGRRERRIATHAKRLRDHGGEHGDVTATHGHAAVGRHAGHGHVRLERVQTVLRLLARVRAIQATALGPHARVAQRQRVGAEHVPIQGHDHAGLLHLWHQTHRCAERDLRAIQRCGCGECLPRRDLRLGVRLSHAGQHVLHRRARGGLRQDGQTFALLGGQRLRALAQPCVELRDVRCLAGLEHLTAALGVVQLQHAGLHPRGACTAPVRMLRVAVELDGATVVAGGHQAVAHATQFGGCGVHHRHAGHAIGWLAGVGNDLALGPATATGQAQARQREARAHDLDEGAAILAVERVGRNGEFAMRERHGLRILLTLAERTPPGRALACINGALGFARVAAATTAGLWL